MANQLAAVFVKIGADVTDLHRGLDDTRNSLNGLQATVGTFQKVVTGAFVAVGAASVGMAGMVAKTGFEFNALREQADIAFTTMLGSGEAAQGMLDELQQFAAKTPFEFPDLIRASQRMMAMGFSAQEVIPTLTAVGDAVAGLGGGAFEIDRVTRALGQMQAKGKTSAEEMLQLTEAGIPAWQMLADKIGVTVPEAMQMVTKGAIDARTTIGAVIEGIETRFGGMMEAQSTTWNGLLSNLKDNFTILSGTVMKPFFDMAKTGLQQLVTITSSPQFTAGVQKLAEHFAILADKMAQGIASGIEWATKVLPPLWERITQVTDVIVKLVQPIADVIGKFVGWKDVLGAVGLLMAGGVVAAIGALVAAMAPLLITIAQITAVIAALRWAWQNDFMGLQTFTRNWLNKITSWFVNESGLWLGSWEKTLDNIGWVVQYGWENYIFFPIRSWLISTRNDIILFAKTAVKTFEQWFSDAKHKFSVGVSVLASYVIQLRDGIISDVRHWASVTQDKIETWVGVIETKFKVWKNNTVGKVTEWRDDLIERFEDAFEWWKPDEWLTKGQEIIAGLRKGIEEKWGALSTWFEGVWGQLTDKFKRFFGIASPSKLFAGYGQNMMQGLATGIKGARSMVTGAMDDISTGLDTTVAASVVGGAANAGGNVSTSRIEQLLEVLIAELRAKNMSVTVNGSQGGGYADLVGFMAGGR